MGFEPMTPGFPNCTSPQMIPKFTDGGHICQQTGSKFSVAQLDHQINIHDEFQINLTSGLGGDVITRSLQCKVNRKMKNQRWLPFCHIGQQTRIIFCKTQLEVER